MNNRIRPRRRAQRDGWAWPRSKPSFHFRREEPKEDDQQFDQGKAAAISSAPGASAAILWALDNNANGTDNCNGLPGPAILRAYDATTLATLYSSDQQGGRDAAGDSSHPAIKFQPPVVANGHVYVAVSGQLVVYGLLP